MSIIINLIYSTFQYIYKNDIYIVCQWLQDNLLGFVT